VSEAHSRFEDLLPAHVLGALDGAERAEMEAHLAGCAACRQQMAEWEDVLADVAEGFEPETVSPELRRRVLAVTEGRVTEGYAPPEIRAGASGPERPEPARRGPERPETLASAPASPKVREMHPSRPRRRGSWVPWLALAASLLALVVSWAGWMTRDLPGQPGARDEVATGPDATPGEADERLAATIGELDQARAEIEILQQRLDRLTLAVQALGSPRGRTYALASDDLDQGPAGAVGATFVDSSLGRGTFHVFGLPPTAEDETYQLWRIREGTPQSEGVFQVAADGSASLSVEALEAAAEDVWAVTIEPAGGVPQPTGPMVLKSS
jgi:anti-sigma-K factor RskA